MVITGDALLSVAQAAMLAMRENAADGDGEITHFNERQFVFDVGTVIRSGALTGGVRPWVAYEYRYPGLDDASRAKTECDIAVFERATNEWLWLECKRTGLDEDGRWNNAFGSLGWAHDFSKVRGISAAAWTAARHHRAWLWLYPFENFQAAATRLPAVGWSPPTTAAALAPMLRGGAANNMTLGNLLTQLAASATDLRVSIARDLGVSQNHSVMLVAAIL
jgi:hypothetical protein